MKLSGETKVPFTALRESAKSQVVDAIETLVEAGADHELSRINALAFAARYKLNEEDVIAAFLHAARLGIFELSWNILCPGCGGVFDTGVTLKTVDQTKYNCALCAAGYEPTLDEMVEVTFTVSPRIRRIAAHDPEVLSWAEYFRQVFWSSGVNLPEGDTYEKLIDEITLDAVELPAGEKVVLSLQLPEAFLIVFDPVIHMAQFIDVKGEPTRERQSLSFIMTKTTHRPARCRCVLALCASPWRIAPAGALCPAFGLPVTNFIIFSAHAALF